MTDAVLELSRGEILGYRRRVGGLDARVPVTATSLRRAAWAGLQDSVPRAALCSLHARLEGVTSTALGHPALVQVWGPRYSAYVVAERDRGVFTRGRLPDEPAPRRRAEDTAAQLREALAGRELPYGEVGRALGVDPNALRYAAPTGTVLIVWDGARQPTVRSVPPPDVEPDAARRELVRRYLRVLGPGTAEGFATWAGLRGPAATRTFEGLRDELVEVATPVGKGWIRAEDEDELRAEPDPPAPARLLPSGDAYTLRWGDDRELLVPDAARRVELWTSRVWPGAILVDGEVAGVWRRQRATVTAEPWRRLTSTEREAIEAEAATLPVPEADDGVTVRWVA